MICGVLCLVVHDQVDSCNVLEPFKGRFGLSWPPGALCSNSQSGLESACGSTVAGSKTGFQWSIRDCRIMFRVRDLMFWRDCEAVQGLGLV